MKKSLLLLLLFLIPIIPLNSGAQDLAQSESDASANANLTYAPTYNSTGGDKRGFPGAYKMDPGYINPLPAIYSEQGWKIWLPTPALARGISMEKIEALRAPCDSDVRAWATFGENSDPIIPLTYYPQGDKVDEMGYVVASGKAKYPIESVIMHSLWLAKKATGSKYVVIFHRPKPVTVGKIRALGTAGVIGKAMGPAGETDQIMGLGALGSGFGNSYAFVDHDYEIRIVVFTAGGIPPQKTKMATVLETPKPQPALPIIYAPSAIYFALNRYDIIGQETNLQEIANYLALNWGQIKSEGKLVWFRGSCDIRGLEGYNDTLGMNRGKTASIALGRLMLERGIRPQEITDTLRYASSGEHQLQFNNHDMNRRVDVIIGKTITQELPPPPYINQ